MIAHITDDLIKGLTRPRRTFIITDTELKGFGIRCYASGKYAYILVYTADQKRKTFSFGDCSVYPLRDARREAKARLSLLARGLDPRADL